MCNVTLFDVKKCEITPFHFFFIDIFQTNVASSFSEKAYPIFFFQSVKVKKREITLNNVKKRDFHATVYTRE